MSKQNFSNSTIGKKIIMGLTGLFLISFLVIHVTLNSFIFFNDGGVSFNAGADFMAHNPIVRILEVGLFAGLLAHIFMALILTIKNNKARPVKYAVTNGNANSKWYSRSMGILGSLLLLFLVVHLGNFWVPTKAAVWNHETHDTFAGMKEVFSKWYFVAIYLVGVISLCYHLLHGFKSAFQSLGLTHKKYARLLHVTGAAFSYVVCLLFAAMPITMHFGLIK
ncbi:MAG TPA: succinate dehydrogenase cytochrome b subunit [Bacteroidia bacterium]